MLLRRARFITLAPRAIILSFDADDTLLILLFAISYALPLLPLRRYYYASSFRAAAHYAAPYAFAC